MEEEKEKKAAQGIGTLIIFIAMILVAAVAAGVLIQTAASLQSKSLDTGRQAQEKITTDLEILQVVAYDTSDGSIDGSVDNLSITIRLGSASTPIKFVDTLIKVDSSVSTKSSNYIYNTTYSESAYNATYLIKGTKHIEGYLVSGDTVQLDLMMPASAGNITEGEKIVVRVIAKNGMVKPVEMHMPSASIEAVTYLYP